MSDLGIKIITRPATSHSQREGYTKPLNDTVIQEQGWTLDNMVERPAYQTTFNWPSTATSHTVLHKFRIPSDFLVNNITSAPFNSFKYWKGSIEVHAQVTATPLHQGCLMMVYVPLTVDATFQTNILPNFSALTVNQTCYMFANTNTSALMTVPFNTPLNYLDLEDTDISNTLGSLGYVYFIVLNQLQLAATASDTVTVSVFSRMKDNQFKVPRFTPETLFAQSSIQRIRKKLLPTEMIGDVIDKAFSIFGMDKPNNANFQEPSAFKSCGPLNYKDGVEHLDVMDVTPNRLDMVEEDTFATLNDEMDLDDLKQRYSYLGSFTQNTTQTPGTVLASIPINPSPTYILNGVANQIPLLTYLSLPFNYWRGGLTYKIQVISTSFQTAKVFFAVNFGQYTASSTIPLSQVTSQYGEAFEINQGSNEFEFTVPYVSKTHSLYVPNSNTPSEIDSLGTINIVVLNSLVAPNNTPLQITYNVFMAGATDYQLSTLSLMNNVSPTFFGPATLMAQSAVQPLNTDEANTYKQSEDLIAPNSTVSMRDYIATQPVKSLRDYLNKYQLLARRPWQLFANATSEPTAVPTSIMILDPLADISAINMSTLPNTGNLLNPSHGLFSYFSPLFRQFKGGLKYKILIEQSPTNLMYSAFYVPKFNNSSTLPFSGLLDYIDANMVPDLNSGTSQSLPSGSFNAQSLMTRLPISVSNSIQKSLEFQIPFNSLYKSVIVKNGYAEPYTTSYSDLTSLGYVVLIAYPTTSVLETEGNYTMSSYIDIFAALSDDSRYGTLYQVPSITPQLVTNSAGTTGSSIFPDGFTPPTNPNNTLTRL